jgi:hypothetical protein
MAEIRSIHPGVTHGKRQHALRNTCGNSSLVKRLTRQLAGIEKHLVNYPRDVLSQSRVSTIKSLLRG